MISLFYAQAYQDQDSRAGGVLKQVLPDAKKPDAGMTRVWFDGPGSILPQVQNVRLPREATSLLGHPGLGVGDFVLDRFDVR